MYSKKKVREINIPCWHWLSALIWLFHTIRHCCIVMFSGHFNLLSNIVYQCLQSWHSGWVYETISYINLTCLWIVICGVTSLCIYIFLQSNIHVCTFPLMFMYIFMKLLNFVHITCFCVHVLFYGLTKFQKFHKLRQVRLEIHVFLRQTLQCSISCKYRNSYNCKKSVLCFVSLFIWEYV